jgi:hypothetical protein
MIRNRILRWLRCGKGARFAALALAALTLASVFGGAAWAAPVKVEIAYSSTGNMAGGKNDYNIGKIIDDGSPVIKNSSGGVEQPTVPRTQTTGGTAAAGLKIMLGYELEPGTSTYEAEIYLDKNKTTTTTMSGHFVVESTDPAQTQIFWLDRYKAAVT